jgi:LmbE family N-acetylglucosaminyl deacetylase
MNSGSKMRIGMTSVKHDQLPQSSCGVVVSPHPDDAVLSCWQVLTRPGVRRVVTVFAGQPAAGTPPSAWDRLTRGTDPRRRALERREEDQRALRPTGCTPVHLDFTGAVHRRAPLDAEALAAVQAAAIGDADVVYAPAAIGGHPDHLAARDAVLAVTAGRRLLLYADQPYAARFGWPSWITGQDGAAGDADGGLDVDGWLDAQLPPGRDGRPILRDAIVCRLPRARHAAKTRAIAEYRSQLAALTASTGPDFPGGPEWSYEVFWPLP